MLACSADCPADNHARPLAQFLYETLPIILKKTIEIQIGNELLINKLGVLIAILGTIAGLFIIAVFVSGTLLPTEMKFIYFVEVIGKNWYIAMLISIFSVIIGIEISKLRLYSKTNLTLKEGKIEFIKKGQLIELPHWKINKISKNKGFFFKQNRIKIKTTTFKEFDLKADKFLFEKLTEMFPYKISTDKKTMGNKI
jgi:hypothetical protein